MAAVFKSDASGDNSATYTVAAGDTTLANATVGGVFADLSSTENARIKAILDKVYTDIPAGQNALTQLLTSLANNGAVVNVVAGSAAAPSPFWTCASGAKPVLNFAAFPAGGGHVRISLSYSASA